jgi:hypothetical protein
MPGAGGKIGKLMERGPTPTVMKHHGRIQIPRNTTNSAKIIHSPMSARGDNLKKLNSIQRKD